MFSKAVPHIFQFNFTDLSKRETPEFTGRAGVFLLSTAPKANKAEKIYLFLYMRNVGKEFYTYENELILFLKLFLEKQQCQYWNVS